MTRLTRKQFIPCLVLIPLLTGCGPSPSEVIEEFRPKYDQLSVELKDLIKQVPDHSVAAQNVEGNPDPSMTLHVKDGGNFEIIAIEILEDPKAKPEFDLYLSPHLATALFWMTRESHETGDVKFMRKTLQAGLDLKYLVAYRTHNLIGAKVVNRSEFLPATIDIEAFVFDLSSKKLLGIVTFTAKTPKDVFVTVYEDQSEEERIPKAIRSALWSDARKKMAEHLKEAAGATLILE